MPLAWRRRFAAAILLCAMACCRAAADDLAEVKRRLATEAYPAWSTMRDRIRTLGGSWTEQITTYPPGKPVFKDSRKIEYCLKGAWQRFVVSKPDAEQRAVLAANPKYVFSIAREKAEYGYHLTGRATPDADARVNVSLQVRELELYAAQQFDDIDIQKAVETGYFRWRQGGGMSVKLTRATTESRAGKELVKLTFETRINDEPVLEAWAYLDPRFHWAVQEYSASQSWGTSTGTIEYNEQIRDFPFPKRITRTDLFANGKVANQEILTFSQPSRCTAPEAEFTLSGYGLREVPIPPPAGSRFPWLWMALSALGMVALVVLVLWRRIRQVG